MPPGHRLLVTPTHAHVCVCVYMCVRAEEAFEESQKYKEGKFILEKEKLIKEALV